MPRCIVVSFDCPPVPTRAWDWCAYVEGEEERMQYGRGATREAAISDLFEQLEEN